MKILSQTLGDGRVLELTAGEWHEFIVLITAIEGKEADDLYFNFHTRFNDAVAHKAEVDFSGVFGAIQAFYEARFKANELRNLVDRFDAYLGNPTLPKKS